MPTYRHLSNLAAKAVLIWCVPLALHGQATATWTGGAGDGNWGNGKNWNYMGTDNNACTPNGVAIPPGTAPVDSTLPCYHANVVIGSGNVNDENVTLSSYIQNFTLGPDASLTGGIAAEGNVTIGPGAKVSGPVSAGPTSGGVLTNAGTIAGDAGGATVINSGVILISAGESSAGLVFANSQGTNTGTIQATGVGTYLGVMGGASLTGPWKNSNGTIQVASGATLYCDATVTGGNFNVANGGAVGGEGNGLTIAGSVNSTGLAIDAQSGPTTATITGTLTIAGNLIVGITGGVSTLKVNAGKLLVNGGTTTLGAQMAATGQLEISGTSQVTTGNLAIGPSGTGYMSVGSDTMVTSGNVIVGSSNLVAAGSGTLVVSGGVMNYSKLQVSPNTVALGEPATIWVYGGGNLIGKSNGQGFLSGDALENGTAIVTGAGSVWKTQNPLYISGGGLTISDGGGVSVSNTLGGTTFVVGSTVDVSGTGSTLAVSQSAAIRGALNITSGAKATFGFLGIGQAQSALYVGSTVWTIPKPPITVVPCSNGTAVVDGAGSTVTVNPPSGIGIFCDSSGLTVQNQAMLTTDLLEVLGTNVKLLAQTKGTISTGSLDVLQGSAIIQNAGALQLSGNKPLISIGDGAAPAVLTFSGSGDNAGTLTSTGASAGIFPNGTLQIAGGDSITIAGPVSLKATGEQAFREGSPSNLPGGTINVTKGALGIGSISGAIQQGWVTVGSGGLLKGGLICPPAGSIAATACIPNSLVGQGTVNGSVVNEGGTVSVDPAILNISQGFQQTGGTLALEIDGTQSSQVSEVSAGGAIQITGGTVELDFANGFAPSTGDKFNVLAASSGLSVSGASFTTTGLASGFNYTSATSNGQFNVTASNSGTATTSAPAPPPTPMLASSDSASGATELAAGSLASGYGNGLATGQPASATSIWPTTIGGTSVTIVDATGTTSQASLLYVSPAEVDYQIPDTVGLGPATVTVTAGNGTSSSGPINVVPYAPGLFAVNSAGLSASFADCVAADGTQTTILTSQVVNGALVAVPLNLGVCQKTILELWSTGLDEADAGVVQATIGGQDATVLYAGPQGTYPGVDQVNLVVPQSLAGSGSVPVVLSVTGVTSNTVNVTIQ